MRDIYSVFPTSEHGKRIEKYFLDKGGEFGLTNQISERTIFICFTNRCGSTYLGSLLTELGLAGLPNEFNNFEFFNGSEVVHIMEKNNLNSLVEYIGHIVEHHSTSHCFTTKVSPDQLVWLTRKNLIGRRFKNPTFIFIKRRDVVSQAISLSIAMQTGKWTSKHSVKDKDIVYNESEIMQYCRLITNANANFELFFQLHGIEPVSIFYEDLIMNQDGFIETLSEEMGISLERKYNNKHDIKKQSTEINKLWKEQFMKVYLDKIMDEKLL